MPASYTVFPIDGVRQMIVKGNLNLEDRRSLMLDIVGDAQLNEHGLLVDLRATSGDLSYRDVHELIHVLTDHPEAFSHRIALLENYTTRFEKAQFFQAYATERGFQVRAFVDEDAAVAWLEEGEHEG